jgi:nitrogen-specific signal transduction histidine kinase/CheY-like chemotaxis protein
VELVLLSVTLVAVIAAVGLASTLRRVAAAVRARDERLAAVTHELRGPLQPIALAVSRLKRDGTLTPKQREAVEIIERNLEAQTRLIEDLWEATRGDRPLSVRNEPCNLNAVLREVADAARERAAEKGLSLETALDAADPWVSADRVRIRQVVRNLVDNAVKFTPTGGRVIVRSDRGAGREVRIEVTDTGAGIAPADQERIFEPYVQLGRDRETGGIGLGLHLARKLVEAQGGTLGVWSDGLGRGSTFTVLMPRAPGPAPKDSPAPPASPGGRRLLLAEDHEDSARMIGELLRARGWQVTSVGTLAAGLTALASSRFDVLVSDLELPDGNGLDLMRKSSANGIRAIALSGRRSDEDLAASKRAGFQSHLLKPLDFEALLAAIEA